MDPNQQNKQNITRDIEIKNKLTVTRGEVGANNGGQMAKGFQEQLLTHGKNQGRVGLGEGGGNHWGGVGG